MKDIKELLKERVEKTKKVVEDLRRKKLPLPEPKR